MLKVGEEKFKQCKTHCHVATKYQNDQGKPAMEVWSQ